MLAEGVRSMVDGDGTCVGVMVRKVSCHLLDKSDDRKLRYEECIEVSALVYLTGIVISLCCYPTPSDGWGHGGRPWSPRKQVTLRGVDHRL